MNNANLDELQSILLSAMRCLDCRDPRCVSLCPEHVDVRAAMQLIVGRSPSNLPSAWMQNAEGATASAMDGVQDSFEI